MKTFNDLVFKQDIQRGLNAARIMFDNGYGVSVIIGPHTYGGVRTGPLRLNFRVLFLSSVFVPLI